MSKSIFWCRSSRWVKVTAFHRNLAREHSDAVGTQKLDLGHIALQTDIPDFEEGCTSYKENATALPSLHLTCIQLSRS